ncbi:hypothetical protein NL448_27645, partial [Klebsiella pneumoniae]|nr:hypothetical protein [Klebsiella pneumoniae]
SLSNSLADLISRDFKKLNRYFETSYSGGYHCSTRTQFHVGLFQQLGFDEKIKNPAQNNRNLAIG